MTRTTFQKVRRRRRKQFILLRPSSSPQMLHKDKLEIMLNNPWIEHKKILAYLRKIHKQDKLMGQNVVRYLEVAFRGKKVRRDIDHLFDALEQVVDLVVKGKIQVDWDFMRFTIELQNKYMCLRSGKCINGPGKQRLMSASELLTIMQKINFEDDTYRRAFAFDGILNVYAKIPSYFEKARNQRLRQHYGNEAMTLLSGLIKKYNHKPTTFVFNTFLIMCSRLKKYMTIDWLLEFAESKKIELNPQAFVTLAGVYEKRKQYELGLDLEKKLTKWKKKNKHWYLNHARKNECKIFFQILRRVRKKLHEKDVISSLDEEEKLWKEYKEGKRKPKTKNIWGLDEQIIFLN